MMHEAVTFPLQAWESFYVIVGSSAGALTGLQFVVMTLIGEAGAVSSKDSIAAFGSPNVVHFCAALLVASILSAPWTHLASAGVAVALCGAGGVVYSVIVITRAHRQRGYTPVFEDWLWHTILPMLAYWSLLLTGVVLGWSSPNALFVVGAAVLLLVFIGIHNAWDTVTFMLVERGAAARKKRTGTGGAHSHPDSEAARKPEPPREPQ